MQGVNDYSASAHAFTTNGNAYSDTAQAKFGTAALSTVNNSGTQNNNLNSASTPTNSDFQFGTGQFTVEAWVYWNTHSATAFEDILSVWNNGGSNLGWMLGMDNTGKLSFYYSTTGSDTPAVNAAYTPTTGTWTHIAADRDASNVLRVYANGVVIASATVTSSLFASTQAMMLGNDNGSARQFPGWIDEVRISNVARFGGAFTPAAAAYTADANTVLLVHFDRGASSIAAKKMQATYPAQQTTTPTGSGARILGMRSGGAGKTVSGTVQENGAAKSGLTVVAFDKISRMPIGIAVTSGTGTYSINAQGFANVFVVGFDPTSFQAQVFDEVTPG